MKGYLLAGIVVAVISLLLLFWPRLLWLIGINSKTVSYTVDASKKSHYQQDCFLRGGVFNSCGSACGSQPGTGCMAVCVPKCEFPGQYRWQVAAIFALGSTTLIGLKAFVDFRKHKHKKPA